MLPAVRSMRGLAEGWPVGRRRGPAPPLLAEGCVVVEDWGRDGGSQLMGAPLGRSGVLLPTLRVKSRFASSLGSVSRPTGPGHLHALLLTLH